MGWWKKLKKGVGKVAGDIWRAHTEPAKQIGNVASGKSSVGDAIRDSVRASIRPFKSVAEAGAELDRIAQRLNAKLAARLGGKLAETRMADLDYIARAAGDPALGVAMLESVDKFIETGKMEYLNPIVIYTAREIQRTRDQLWDGAHDIPKEILDALPDEVRKIASGVRWMLESRDTG